MENFSSHFREDKKITYFFEKLYQAHQVISYFVVIQPSNFIFLAKCPKAKSSFDERRRLALSTEKLFVRYIFGGISLLTLCEELLTEALLLAVAPYCKEMCKKINKRRARNKFSSFETISFMERICIFSKPLVWLGMT